MTIRDLIAALTALDLPDARVVLRIAVTDDHGHYQVTAEPIDVEMDREKAGVVLSGEVSL